jgi:hypothetical protein
MPAPDEGTAATANRPPAAWGRRLRFWALLVLETLTRRDLARLARTRLGLGQPAVVTGLDHLPRLGTFVLAVNHYDRGLTLDVAAAVLLAAGRARPEVGCQLMIVSGQRARPPARGWLRFHPGLALVDYWHRRWAGHLLRLPWRNRAPSIAALRAWRQRLARQPALVFPEAQASLRFGTIRPGAGRWLGTLAEPTVPVGVWWQAGGWQVRFGPPLRWSHRPELHDYQLGLMMAALLPADLAGAWRDDLCRWRAAHGLGDDA